MFNLEINDLDKKIWDEELNDFVPEKVYDVHTHIYQWQSNLDKNKNTGPYKYQGENFLNVSFDLLDKVDNRINAWKSCGEIIFPLPL
jgi:glutamate-1-semialdehyde 2,1-aminomutase